MCFIKNRVIVLVFFIFSININGIKCDSTLSKSDVLKTVVVDDLKKEQLFGDDAILKIISQTADNPTQNNYTMTTKSRNFQSVIINASILCDDCIKSRNIITKCFHRNNNNSELIKLSDVGHEKSTLSSVTLARDNAEYTNYNATLHEATNTRADFFSPQNLFDIVPPFDLQSTPEVSEKCRMQSAIYVENLKLLRLWALKMYDSSTKIPSGFLNGNINQYGDIDQCMGVKHDVSNSVTIRGQYCLASLQLSLSNNASQSMKQVFELVHSHYAFRSKLTDPGHRVPRFSSITWALCVPSGCTSQDVQLGIQHSISLSSLQIDVSAEVLVEGSMCQVEYDRGFSKGFKYVGSIFLVFLLLAVLGTVGEIFNKESIPEWIRGFSVLRNMRNILSIKPPSSSEDEVKAVHGIRCLNAIMLLIAHKSMAIFFLPYINRTHMAELLGQPWSVIGRTASLYTDPFIMFSGLLTCYSILGKHRKGQSVSIINEYLCRLFRLLPTMGALMLFCTWVLPELSSGPQWPLVITQHAHICKNNWWRNLLFIHNYFGFENMCLTHTHHVGIDTQLFLLGVPLSLWLVTNTTALKKNIIILITVALASTVGRFYITYTMELANFVSYGSSVEQLFRTADYMYIIPAYRITVYIMGMLLALLLRNPPQQKLRKKQLRLGWILSVALFLTAFLLPAPMSLIGYKYDALSAALYAALAPIGWSASFGWIIYTQHHGYNSWLGDIFSWRVFAIWTRLSYSIYLTQFPVFFYLVGTTRSPQYYTVIEQTVNFKELILITVSSVLLTLLFDLPFQNIRKIVCRSGKSAPSMVKKPTGKIDETIKKSNINKTNEFIGQSVAIVERNTDKKLWKAD